MKKDLIISPLDFNSSFLSCEKDLETILRKLFIESQPFSDDLKRLLVINTKDCLDNKNSQVYNNILKDISIATLREKGYIKFEPRISMVEHEDVKSYLIFSFDNFQPNPTNPEFRDCNIYIEILCHTSYWDLGGCRLRPLKICGYIDGILNKSKLSGIGTLQFMGCTELILDETLSGYNLCFRAVHGSDDKLPENPLGWTEKYDD